MASSATAPAVATAAAATITIAANPNNIKNNIETLTNSATGPAEASTSDVVDANAATVVKTANAAAVAVAPAREPNINIINMNNNDGEAPRESKINIININNYDGEAPRRRCVNESRPHITIENNNEIPATNAGTDAKTAIKESTDIAINANAHGATMPSN